MANEQNLTPFQKGQVTNPKGRGKGTPNGSTIAKLVLAMDCETPDTIHKALKTLYPGLNPKNSIEFIGTLQQAHKMITQKDTQAYIAIMNRAYGAPTQPIDMDPDEIKGAKLKAWTAEEIDEFERFQQLKAEGLITDQIDEQTEE